MCPAEVFQFGDLNDPNSSVSLFHAKHAGQLQVLKPEEKTRPSVKYRGIGTVAPREMENKIQKGRNHDPFSYEIDPWNQLESQCSPPQNNRS